MKTILVTGYPRSGNTWTSRMIADALDCSLKGSGDRVSLAAIERGGAEYRVVQDHLLARDSGPFIQPPKSCNPAKKQGNFIIYVERDPRDVAVSAFHYWEIKSMIQTIRKMQVGEAPLSWSPWLEFVTGWRRRVGFRYSPVDYHVKYEWLHENAMDGLSKILESMDAEPQKPLHSVAERNSFSSLRLAVMERGDEMPYGQAIQMKHLRRGHVGDWRRFFSRADGEYAHRVFWPALKAMGYEDDENWWQELPVEPKERAPHTMKELGPNPKQSIW